MPAERPNILCLVLDQLRWDCLGCYGNGVVQTPHIDALAGAGVTCDNAFVVNPLCMPARATLFTGWAPRAHGVRTNGIPLRADIPTMPEALRQAGYRTHSVGKLHLQTFNNAPGLADSAEAREVWDSGAVTRLPSPYYGLESADFVGGHTGWVWGEYVNWVKAERPELLPAVYGREVLEDWTPICEDHAFKSAVPEEWHYNRFIADRTCDFLRAQATAELPFFCWTSFPDPHHAFTAPQPYCDLYDPAAMPLPVRREGELDDLPPFYRIIHDKGPGQWKCVSGRFQPTHHSDDALRHIRAMTYAMITFVDTMIGRVLATLAETGQAENTVVCLLADHGEMLGDHGIMNKGPFHFDGLVRTPLVWRWPGHLPAGTRTAGLVSQLDFAPTVLDLCGVPIPEGPHPEPPEARLQRPPWPGHALRPLLQGDTAAVRDAVIIENDEDYLGVSVRTLVTDDYKLTFYSGHPDWGELFDRRQDPQELHNRWHDPAMQEVKRDLLVQFAYRYVEEESALPRRVCHA